MSYIILHKEEFVLLCFMCKKDICAIFIFHIICVIILALQGQLPDLQGILCDTKHNLLDLNFPYEEEFVII
jgi:hypothetical protein